MPGPSAGFYKHFTLYTQTHSLAHKPKNFINVKNLGEFCYCWLGLIVWRLCADDGVWTIVQQRSRPIQLITAKRRKCQMETFLLEWNGNYNKTTTTIQTMWRSRRLRLLSLSHSVFFLFRYILYIFISICVYVSLRATHFFSATSYVKTHQIANYIVNKLNSIGTIFSSCCFFSCLLFWFFFCFGLFRCDFPPKYKWKNHNIGWNTLSPVHVTRDTTIRLNLKSGVTYISFLTCDFCVVGSIHRKS